ncbi:MAG: hypothetical protein CV087_13290 [Candidatus Brocadia sp. WS118]|nr:MAG: hypothetical protein CV087_13290 [Candidatus Brocadia sp. WS118]
MGEKGIQVVMRNINDHVSAGRTCTEVFEGDHVRFCKKHGVARETLHGKILANAAKATKNTYVIQKTFDNTKSNIGSKHSKGKWDMEQYMRSWLACNHLPAGNFHM